VRFGARSSHGRVLEDDLRLDDARVRVFSSRDIVVPHGWCSGETFYLDLAGVARPRGKLASSSKSKARRCGLIRTSTGGASYEAAACAGLLTWLPYTAAWTPAGLFLAVCPPKAAKGPACDMCGKARRRCRDGSLVVAPMLWPTSLLARLDYLCC